MAEAEFAGMLIITKRKYVDGGGVLYCGFVIKSDDGIVIKELGDCK
jgi:hypothetical protein